MNAKKPGALFVLFLLLLCAVLTAFFSASEDYYDYASGAAETAVRASAPQPLPAASKAQAEKLDTEIKFRHFFITVPGAKQVELQADFNGWGKTPLPLHAYSKGYFETSVALPAGEYKYVFVVDGQDMPDPTNQDRIQYQDRTVCIKTVK